MGNVCKLSVIMDQNKQADIKQERDTAIDILKFLAVFLITWSHFEAPLGKYAVLATGGALGDSLFFFMSGYTLLLSSKKLSFFNWYKRRINRIYPTVFAWALLSVILFGRCNDILHILLYGGGFFVTCIMVFYLLFYPIKQHVPISYWGGVIGSYFLLQGGAYFFLDHNNHHTEYVWQWSSYFIPMLVGALIGKKKKEGSNDVLFKMSKLFVIIGLLFSVMGYYLLMYLERSMPILTIFNIIPLVGFAYFLYGLCSSFTARVFAKKWIYWTVRFVGGLCLEVYIVQPSIITDRLNHLFPFNLLILFVAIIFAAYCLHCLANLWAQTFKDGDYNWIEMVKPL